MSKLRLGLAVSGSVVILLFAGVVATRAFPILGGHNEGLAAKPYAVAVEASRAGDSHHRFKCHVTVTDVATNEVVSEPTFFTSAGEEAKGSTAHPDGREFIVSVLPSLDGTTVSYHFVAKKGATVLQENEGVAKVGLPPPVAPIPDESGTYPMGSIEAPKLIKQVNPVYPEEARKKGLKGKVVLEVVINQKGETTEVKVLKSENNIFNASAKAAVEQWRYEIPRLNGKPVSVRWIININFVASP